MKPLRKQIERDLLTDPRYKHLVHRSKHEILQRQLLEEGEQEIKEYLNDDTKEN